MKQPQKQLGSGRVGRGRWKNAPEKQCKRATADWENRAQTNGLKHRSTFHFDT